MLEDSIILNQDNAKIGNKVNLDQYSNYLNQYKYEYMNIQILCSWGRHNSCQFHFVICRVKILSYIKRFLKLFP